MAKYKTINLFGKTLLTVVFYLFSLSYTYAQNSENNEVTSSDTTQFETFTEIEEFAPLEEVKEEKGGLDKREIAYLLELAAQFALLILISLFIKNEKVRKLRPFVLLASLAYLGFYKGGCPCMIMSMENSMLIILGKTVKWTSIVLFVSLLPLTYFFGKIWCGWLCPLGALQEFLSASSKFKLLQSNKAQRNLRYLRVFFLIAFIVQTAITQTYLWGKIDPFKVAFNLTASNTIGVVLLILLFVTSILIYRPFCRGMCPVGLVLGWVTMIPGAKKITKKEACIDCRCCSNVCKTKAIVNENNKTILNAQDCIVCGDCFGSCKKDALCIVKMKE